MNAGVLSETIRALIKSSGKTIRDVARESGLPEQTLYTMTRLKTDLVSLSGLKKISDYFGKTLEYFLDPDGYVQPIELDATERKLLTEYRRLNQSGQERVKDYVDDLCTNSRYVK